MRIFHPLRRPPVALLWGGLSFSAIGDQLYGVALAWIATGVLGAAAGYLSALQALTILLVALLSGGWADRRNQLLCMLGADLARAAVLLLLVALWLATGSPTAPGLAVAVVALAVGQALFQPALQSVLPALVGDAPLLPAANGLFDGTDRSARLLGPGLVALLAGSLPLVHFLSLDAVSFLVSATALSVIARSHPLVHRPPVHQPPVHRAGAPAGTPAGTEVLGSIRLGVRAMRRHPLLGYVLASAGPLNGAWYAVFFLGLPLLLKQQDVHGPGETGLGAYGMLISLYGCTNLLSNIVCGSRSLPARPQFQMFGGSLVVGAGMASFALFGLLPPEARLPAYAAAAALCGIGGPMKDIPVAVLRQSRMAAGEVPAATRAMLAANSLGVLAAMLLVLTLLTERTLPAVVGACGGVAFVVGAVGLIRHAGWLERPGLPARSGRVHG